jgi:DNA-directed RNA polymerase beta subunit
MLSQIKDPNTGEFLIDKDQLAIVLSGLIDATSKKLELDLTTEIENYEKNNKNVKSMAFKYVRYALIALISISILLLFIGNCYRNMVGEMFMETLSVIMVVAVTELLFLETIGARYISADPNRVKRKLASSIIDYINNRDDSVSIPGGLNCNFTDVSNNLSNQLNDLNNQIQNELGPVDPDNIDDVINTKTQSIKQSLEDNLSTQFSELRDQIKQELGDIDEQKINQLIQSKTDLVNQTINECLPSPSSQRKIFNL